MEKEKGHPMTHATDPMEGARELYVRLGQATGSTSFIEATDIALIAAALREAEARGLREAADYASDCEIAEAKHGGALGRDFILAFHKVAYWCKKQAKERER